MNTLTIFSLQLVLSITVFALIARWFVAPWLARKPIHEALLILALPHAFRHLGLAFLVPGLVGEGIPKSFATAAAYGDFASGLLAILAILALRGRWNVAMPLVWIFNVVGTLDLANALRQAEAVPHLITTWYIPTFFVPVLLVTHAMSFARLVRPVYQRSIEPATPLGTSH